MNKRFVVLTVVGVCLVVGAVAMNQISRRNASPDASSKAAFFVDPGSPAAVQAKAWKKDRPEQAEMMRKLAALPTAKWWTSADSLWALVPYMEQAKKAKNVPVLVAYYLPGRDCGRYSAGGATESEYGAFIRALASGIGTNPAIVVLEPDALAGIDGKTDQGRPCLTDAQKSARYRLMKEAVATLKTSSATTVYVDAGNSGWNPDALKMAGRLRKAGAEQADGFSLNVSNFQTTDSSVQYGEAISSQLGGKHFVVDTSRNGVGTYTNAQYPDYSWCNPPNRALGHFPTRETGNVLVDAYLYIKYPGESDGQDANPGKCFDGPQAGAWWPEYALGLVERWPVALQPR